MPWKTTDDGSIEVRDGAPVWINAKNEEIAYDPTVTHSRLSDERGKVTRLEAQIRESEERLEALRWAGDDPEATRKELDELRALKRKAARKGGDNGDGEHSAELDEALEKLHQFQSANESLTKKLEQAEKSLEQQRASALAAARRTAFQSTKLYAPWHDDDGQRRDPETLLDPTAAEAVFGGYVWPDGNGGHLVTERPEEPNASKTNVVMSDGKPAGLDEGLRILFDRWPARTSYVRTNKPGSAGADESGGGASGGAKISRKRYDAMPPLERRKFIADGGDVVDA